MGCAIICFKTSKTLHNFPHDTKSNKELQTVIFCTEGTAFDRHVSRETATACPPLWRQNHRCVRGRDTTPTREHCGHDVEFPPEPALWQPKGCSAAAWWPVGETAACHETKRACYATLHQVAVGFFETMSTVERRHEICNCEGQEAL